MSLRRKENWPTLLDSFLRAHHRERFAFGRWDCCLFVCDAVRVMTGTDLAAAFRTYSSAREARDLIVRTTGRQSVAAIVEYVTALYAMPEVPALHARRGDMVLISRSEDFALALVGLDGDLIVTAESGLWRLPPRLAQRAWQV